MSMSEVIAAPGDQIGRGHRDNRPRRGNLTGRHSTSWAVAETTARGAFVQDSGKADAAISELDRMSDELDD